jgi:hypothetical protein
MYDPGAHQLASEAWQAWYDEHEFDGFHNYRSPFDTEEPMARSLDYGAHQSWLIHRGLYEASGSQERLDQMLSHVTLTNPPLLSWPEYHADSELATNDDDGLQFRKWTPQDIAASSLAIIGAITCAGLFGGFKAAASVLVVLFVIFAISWIVSD